MSAARWAPENVHEYRMKLTFAGFTQAPLTHIGYSYPFNYRKMRPFGGPAARGAA
jgi:hypothetical protein